MIVDTRDQLTKYEKINPYFKKAFQFMRDSCTTNLEDGTYDIVGKNVFAIVSTACGRGKKRSPLEAHRKYVDIQFPLKGVDVIGWKPVYECMHKKTAYNPRKDIVFFADTPHDWVTVRPGMVVILFPEDGHAPLAGKGVIKKVVVKVAV